MSAKAIAGFGLGALLVVGVAMSPSKASASTPAGPAGDPWDANIPEALKNDIKRLIANETNPATLRQFAQTVRAQGFPKAAALLEAAAARLEAGKPPLASQVPNLGAMPEQLRAQLASQYLSGSADDLAKQASALLYTGFNTAASVFEARALQRNPGQKFPPMPQQWDNGTPSTTVAAWRAYLSEEMAPLNLAGYSMQLKNTGYPQASQTFAARSLILNAAINGGAQLPQVQPQPPAQTPPQAQPPAQPPPATVPASWVPPTPPGLNLPPLPTEIPPLPQGFPPIPGFPPQAQPPQQPPPQQPPPQQQPPAVPPVPPFVPPVPAVPPLPGLPQGFPPIPGFPPQGQPPQGQPPAPGPVAPSAYGLPAGYWINQANQVAYVVQPGDYGQKIVAKLGIAAKGSEWPYVAQLVKANPQVKDWTKVAPGTDVSIPPEWRPLKAGERTTTRPGPPSPGTAPTPPAPTVVTPPAPPAGLPAVPPGFPPLPGTPAPPPGFPAVPGTPPAPWIGPGQPSAPPAPVAPSAYGLPAGYWINQANQVAYVIQPGDYGQKIVAKLGIAAKGAEWPYVAQLVKANPQVKNWSAAPAGTDLNIPPEWRPLKAGERTTTRPGPPSPGAQLEAKPPAKKTPPTA